MRPTGPILAHILAFIEILGRAHGAAGREAELLGGFLLQGAGGERRGRILLPVALFDLGDDERPGPDRVHHRPGIGLGLQLGLVTRHLVEAGLEGLAVLGAERLDGPVLLRREGADLPLPLDDQPKRDGLHPAGGETGLDAVPEDGAGLVADQPVENAASLLRVDLSVVDPSRLAQRFLDGVLGDLVKQDPVGGDAGVELVGDVPGDRLALAVRVGGQVDGRCALGRFLELGQRLGLALDGDVLRFEPALHVHAQLAGGQVPHVADGGLHVIAGTQVLPDGLGLGGRLDDDERGSPRAPPG